MLSFTEFVSELAREEIVIPPLELRDLRQRFGEKVLQMGHIDEDGAMAVPVYCIVEAARSIGSQRLMEAAQSIGLKDRSILGMLESAEILVDRIAEAREHKLRRMIREFQGEDDRDTSQNKWKQIEKEVFGVRFTD